MENTSGSRGKLAKLLVIAFVILLLNSSYLASTSDPTIAYFTNLAFHMGFGIVLAIVYGVFLFRQRKRLPRSLMYISAVLGLGAAFGLFLIIFGAYHYNNWAIYCHIGVAGLGSALMLIYLYRAARGYFGSRIRTLSYLAVAGLVFIFPVASTAYNNHSKFERDRITNPGTAPATMNGEGGGPNSPFFPSSAETNVGGIIPSTFFMTSKDCGRCHKDIYQQWSSSAHHFSSFNNQWYRKAVEYMQDVVGTKPSRWCAGCHDHAVFFNGRFDKPMKLQDQTPEAQAGLACTSCHSIIHVGSTMGQGNFEIEYPPLHDLATSKNPVVKFLHDFLLRCDPEPHRETFIKDFHTAQTPEFCSVCHKVHLDVPVNDYRWIRGFDEYDNWQASGVSGQGARSFYYPPKPRNCADCHMPLVPSNDPAAHDGLIHSHRFPGANTALPYVNKDPVQLKTVEDFLKANQVSVDVFGIARTAEPRAEAQGKIAGSEGPRVESTFGVGEEAGDFGQSRGIASTTPPVEVIGPLNKVNATVRRGESLRVEVVVRTRGVGHFFPGGTVDASEVWVELEAVDNKGQEIFHSGVVEDNGKGPVDPGAHFYRSLQLDDHGNIINKRNAWATRSVAYVKLIPPGAADTVHYRLNIPENCGDKIYLRAKVNYRKFNWWNTQWAFAGVRDPNQKDYSVTPSHDDGRWVFTGDTSGVSGKIKAIPNIPITVMAYSEASLNVIPANEPLPNDKPYMDKSVREQWNDYGIGLLLQGDLKGAEAAFLKVTEMDPGYADGWVNVGRARLQEGNLAGAEQVLRKALEVDPNLAKTHYFLATVLTDNGKYDEALKHLSIASALYPRDRVVLDDIGHILFLKREYKQAIDQFQRVMGVDPEDLEAHYNLMLCYQGLGNSDMAKKEQALYERFKANEAAQFITGPFRQLHPNDNNERQPIHEHHSFPLQMAKGDEYSTHRIAKVSTRVR